MLEKILDLNQLGTEKSFDRIVIISDRDEVNTEADLITKIENKFSGYEANFLTNVVNNQWNDAEYINMKLDSKTVSFLPLIIPFEDTGAIETFLLNALSEACEVDKKVIDQCKTFIETIDCTDNDNSFKYLKHRREKTKAKFDTAFVVMTPAEAFEQRRTLLRSVPWEEYESIQDSFKQLSKLSETSK